MASTPANPTLLWVHADHLKRPWALTNAARAVVWRAVYEPFGAVHALTGPAALEMRFPGQWFQLEAGLAYNWHRHYDATLGRYTQPGPLGLIDGPSVYGYAHQTPLMKVDPTGLFVGNFGTRWVSAEQVCGSDPELLLVGSNGEGIKRRRRTQQFRCVECGALHGGVRGP